jgi:allophanate hydrolase
MEDIKTVYRIGAEYDPSDPFSRISKKRYFPFRSFRFGVPSRKELEFFGDDDAANLFEVAISRVEAIGGIRTEINFSPFREVAGMLHQGHYLAERLHSIQSLYESKKEAIHPVIRGIVSRATNLSAVDAFDGYYRLKELQRRSEREWAKMDVLLLPTTGTIYTIESVLADPVRLNANLGYYTNFVNLFDLTSISLRSGFRPDGLPFGITLTAPLFQDENLCSLGDIYLSELDGLPVKRNRYYASKNGVRLAVTGEYMTGQNLNGELVERGGVLSKKSRTAKGYGLYLLSGAHLFKPCLGRRAEEHAIEIEVWELPVDQFGLFAALLPAPFEIGTVLLEDGEEVKGILCEGFAISDARDISEFGEWKRYIESLSVVGEE